MNANFSLLIDEINQKFLFHNRSGINMKEIIFPYFEDSETIFTGFPLVFCMSGLYISNKFSIFSDNFQKWTNI